MITFAASEVLLQAPSYVGYEIVASAYEKGRPDYPQTAMAHFISALKLEPGKWVLDLAAGTGKLSKAVQESGVDLVGVEPVLEMRKIFSRELPGVSILEGSAEQIPLEDGAVDCVMVGTAFHWFDGEKALNEIARVLKPRGKLGLIWNIFDKQAPWVREVRALLEKEMVQQNPTHDSLEWKNAFDETTLFGPLLHLTYSYCYPGTAQDVVNRVFSAKVLGMVSAEKRDEIVSRVLHILDTHPATRGKEIFDIPYRVEIYWTQKL